MKWIVLLGLLSSPVWAQDALVFNRISGSNHQIVLQTNQHESILAQGPGTRLHPQLSADGKRIVWAEGSSDKKMQIVIYDRLTQGRERWDIGKTGILHPRFSRDNKHVFFSQPRPSGHRVSFFEADANRTRLMSVDPDGTRVFKPTLHEVPHTGSGLYPQPSADGSFVIFQRKGLFSQEIIEFDLTTRKERVLAEGDMPSLSADEVWVLYTLKGDVWITNRISGDSVALTNTSSSETAPFFTADNRVNFSANTDGHYQLYQLQDHRWLPLVKSSSDDTNASSSGEMNWLQSSLAPIQSSALVKTLAHQGKVYALGEAFFVFDPANKQWRALASRPVASPQSVLAASGKFIYAFGTHTNGRVDRYDITTDRWEQLPSLTMTPQTGVTIEDTVYLFSKGGSDVVLFSLTTGDQSRSRWSAPTQLQGKLKAIEYQENILLLAHDGFIIFDPRTGFTRELMPAPVDVESAAFVVVGDELLALGGLLANTVLGRHVYAFDLTNRRWRHTGRYLRERRAYAEVAQFDEGVMIIGGDEDSERQTVETLRRSE